MTLVIEDGTGKPDANSYASVADIRAFAEARGYTLPAEDTEVERRAIVAMDYLESLDYMGDKTNPEQALAWPRNYGIVWPDDAIPVNVKKAQCIIVCELAKGLDLFPVRTDGGVKRKKVGPLETEYFAASADFPDIPLVAALLSKLLVPVDEFSLQTVRV